MYARLRNGIVEEFCGDTLRYTRVENGIMYYIQIINPTESDFNEAGFYQVRDDENGGFETEVYSEKRNFQ